MDLDQLDLGAIDPGTAAARHERSLKVEIWYPATHGRRTPLTYEDAMDSEPPAPPAKVQLRTGGARRQARAGRFPS